MIFIFIFYLTSFVPPVILLSTSWRNLFFHKADCSFPFLPFRWTLALKIQGPAKYSHSLCTQVRIIQVGRDLWRSSSPTYLLRAGQTQRLSRNRKKDCWDNLYPWGKKKQQPSQAFCNLQKVQANFWLVSIKTLQVLMHEILGSKMRVTHSHKLPFFLSLFFFFFC